MRRAPRMTVQELIKEATDRPLVGGAGLALPGSQVPRAALSAGAPLT